MRKLLRLIALMLLLGCSSSSQSSVPKECSSCAAGFVCCYEPYPAAVYFCGRPIGDAGQCALPDAGRD